VSERAWPVPRDGEVVVEIAAANVNPTDLSARTGAARRRIPDLTPPFVPGWDLAGEAGSEAVVGMIPWTRMGGRVGAYAEAAAVDLAWLVPRPGGLDAVTAATIPLNALTARQGLELIGAAAGATLLVTGASGAVGSFTTQLAVRAGLRVLALASAGDEDWVAGLGAHEVLSRDIDLAQVGPVDAVFDAVPIGAGAVAALRDGGAAVFTRPVEDVPDNHGFRTEIVLVQPDREALVELVELVAGGQLRTRVARTFDLADAADAHRLVERGGVRGKLVLTTG
jgi:NADPH2:quinone reductase